jgi:hypothetical protein
MSNLPPDVWHFLIIPEAAATGETPGKGTKQLLNTLTNAFNKDGGGDANGLSAHNDASMRRLTTDQIAYYLPALAGIAQNVKGPDGQAIFPVQNFITSRNKTVSEEAVAYQLCYGLNTLGWLSVPGDNPLIKRLRQGETIKDIIKTGVRDVKPIYDFSVTLRSDARGSANSFEPYANIATIKRCNENSPFKHELLGIEGDGSTGHIFVYATQHAIDYLVHHSGVIESVRKDALLGSSHTRTTPKPPAPVPVPEPLAV